MIDDKSIQLLKQLHPSLLILHKSLCDEWLLNFEKQSEVRLDPTQKIHLLMNDPGAQWMKPLTHLIGDIDDFTSRRSHPTSEQIQNCIQKVQEVVLDPEKSKVAQNLIDQFNKSPDIIVAYKQTKQMIDQFNLREYAGQATKRV